MNCAIVRVYWDWSDLLLHFLDQVWDYQTKSCVQTLEGHAHNVSVVCFHPELPTIITGSEDGTVRLWHSTTYRYSLSHTMILLGDDTNSALSENQLCFTKIYLVTRKYSYWPKFFSSTCFLFAIIVISSALDYTHSLFPNSCQFISLNWQCR